MNPNKNIFQADVVINDDVLISMAGTAALEVEGVAGLAAQIGDIRRIIRRPAGTATGGVRVNRKDGDITLDIFICVTHSAKIIEVADAVQRNVKNTVQDMTGSAVSAVNVHVSDIDIKPETPENPHE